MIQVVVEKKYALKILLNYFISAAKYISILQSSIPANLSVQC